MRKHLIIFVLLISAVISGCSLDSNSSSQAINSKSQSEESVASYHKVSPENAFKMLNDDENAIILDVRTEEEYNSGHIKNAMLIPDTELAEKAQELLPNKAETILVYCRSGRRSANSANLLVDMGYTAVYDFGGMNDAVPPFEKE